MNLTFEKDFPEQMTRPFDPVERVQINNLRYLSTRRGIYISASPRLLSPTAGGEEGLAGPTSIP